jgi:hypothetical protein
MNPWIKNIYRLLVSIVIGFVAVLVFNYLGLKGNFWESFYIGLFLAGSFLVRSVGNDRVGNTKPKEQIYTSAWKVFMAISFIFMAIGALGILAYFKA